VRRALVATLMRRRQSRKESSAPASGEALQMDPRNTPGYRLHRSLTNLRRIETAGLNDADQERIEAAKTLLQNVSLITQPQHGRDGDAQIEP
jgi:uncharacterized membrane protein